MAGTGAVAQFLWKLLDDIDTLDDAARGDDVSFRKHCREIQRRRFEVGTTDGYTVTFSKDWPEESIRSLTGAKP